MGVTPQPQSAETLHSRAPQRGMRVRPCHHLKLLESSNYPNCYSWVLGTVLGRKRCPTVPKLSQGGLFCRANDRGPRVAGLGRKALTARCARRHSWSTARLYSFAKSQRSKSARCIRSQSRSQSASSSPVPVSAMNASIAARAQPARSPFHHRGRFGGDGDVSTLSATSSTSRSLTSSVRPPSTSSPSMRPMSIAF